MDITIYTVATLPPASNLPGTILLVNDAIQNPASNSGVVVAGGGTTRTRVLSDGSSWRVFGHSRKGGGGTLADNFFNAAASNGGSVNTADRIVFRTFFDAISAANLLGKLSRIGVFAAGDQPTAEVDLLSLQKITRVNGGVLTFTAYQGFNSNGTSSFIDTNFIPPDTRLVQDSASFIVGSLSSRAAGADNALGGTAEIAGGMSLLPWTSGNTLLVDLHGPVFSNAFARPGSPATVKGLYSNDRLNFGTITTYINGVQVNNNPGNTSQAVFSKSILLCAIRNTDGISIFSFDTGIIPCWACGSHLTATDHLALANAFNALMTSFGSPLF